MEEPQPLVGLTSVDRKRNRADFPFQVEKDRFSCLQMRDKPMSYVGDLDSEGSKVLSQVSIFHIYSIQTFKTLLKKNKV